MIFSSILPRVFGRWSTLEAQTWIVWVLASVELLRLRLWLAMPFWKSGQTKWESFPTQFSNGAKFLFQYEYKINLGFTQVDFPFPETVALLSGYTEIIFPVMLVLGIFTRFAALGLLGSTFIIQFVYPSAWMIHGSWAIAALVLFYTGGGLFSADAGLRKVLGMPFGKK